MPFLISVLAALVFSQLRLGLTNDHQIKVIIFWVIGVTFYISGWWVNYNRTSKYDDQAVWENQGLLGDFLTTAGTLTIHLCIVTAVWWRFL